MTNWTRVDGRFADELRRVSFDRSCSLYAEGSAYVTWGNTQVLCTASVEDKVPPFLRGSGQGWLSAEYSMLPRSTHSRKPRDISKLKLDGRGSEIQRLIGRCLRAAVDLERLGERTIWIDCDVIQADGGTRSASICGAFIALVDALGWLAAQKLIETDRIYTQVAAVSVGKVNGRLLLDLCFEEDRIAQADCNVVMTSAGQFVEIQGTAESGGSFDRQELDDLLNLAEEGLQTLFARQSEVLA